MINHSNLYIVWKRSKTLPALIDSVWTSQQRASARMVVLQETGWHTAIDRMETNRTNKDISPLESLWYGGEDNEAD